MYKGQYVSVIIAAAGMGNRMQSNVNKQFIYINNKPVLAHTIEKFEKCRYVDEIIVVSKESEINYCKRQIVKRYKFNKVTKIVRGGKERQDSVYNGILALDRRTDIVISHDGARPFVSNKNIVDSIEGVAEYGACVIGTPVKDTIKIIGEDKNVDSTPKREMIWAAQTPQSFTKEIIMKAYREAIDDNFVGTDDSMLVERLGIYVKMIRGSYENIKITTPEDIIIAEAILKDSSSIYSREEFAY